METAERICTKFTGKACLVPRSDERECQGQRPKVKVTRDKNKKLLSHAAPDGTNIFGTAEQICAKFTEKTCLVPRNDELNVKVKGQ